MTTEIKSRVIGNLGHITLNRPKALNALTYEMCAEITKLLVAWEADPKIGAVLVDGAGDRAFCAGGDVVLLHDSGKAGDTRAENFWRTEYALNELIHRYTKPYITLIDGIVMGGGVGLSVHGRLRIAGDDTIFAMPETGIGYFPDVGGSYFLPRLGVEIGQWLGLTGAQIKTGLTCELGIANAFVPSTDHSKLIKALGKAHLDGSDAAVVNVLYKFVKKPPTGEGIPPAVAAFGEKTVPAILRALEADDSLWAKKQVAYLRRKSPLACCVTFEALRRGSKMNFREAMTQDLDISLNFLNTQDFYEGIRAQLIDKDRNPKWSHDDMDSVPETHIQRLFQKVANPPQHFINLRQT